MYCSVRCIAQPTPRADEMLGLLRQCAHTWMTASDLAIWVYGDDTTVDRAAVRATIYRLRRAGHRIASRPAGWEPPHMRATRAFRLVEAARKEAAA